MLMLSKVKIPKTRPQNRRISSDTWRYPYSQVLATYLHGVQTITKDSQDNVIILGKVSRAVHTPAEVREKLSQRELYVNMPPLSLLELSYKQAQPSEIAAQHSRVTKRERSAVPTDFDPGSGRATRLRLILVHRKDVQHWTNYSINTYQHPAWPGGNFQHELLWGCSPLCSVQETNARAYEMETICLDPLARHLHQLFHQACLGCPTSAHGKRSTSLRSPSARLPTSPGCVLCRPSSPRRSRSCHPPSLSMALRLCCPLWQKSPNRGKLCRKREPSCSRLNILLPDSQYLWQVTLVQQKEPRPPPHTTRRHLIIIHGFPTKCLKTGVALFWLELN